MAERQKFHFDFSLEILNHLGRNLYRNFITIIGETISNSWDADANNVWIDINRENNTLTVTDDGIGMNEDEFQHQFLKIGHKKRLLREKSPSGRRYIGAKGIGKLALLSCANQVTIVSKSKNFDFIGGQIDNQELDDAIKVDKESYEYLLGDWDQGIIECGIPINDQGTIIYFNGLYPLMRNRLPFIKKLIALTFRFALLDEKFNIFVNGSRITIESLAEFLNDTEFCWTINDFSDEFTKSFKNALIFNLETKMDISGFLATVEHPSKLKIIEYGDNVNENASVDLFVNGRLREKNILRHIRTHRIVESYMFGQIHFNSLEKPGVDPFTTSREGVIENNKEFRKLLAELKLLIAKNIFDQWDEERLNRNKSADDENIKRLKLIDRKVGEILTEKVSEFTYEDVELKEQIGEDFLNELLNEARFNVSSYIDCFLAENVCRRFIEIKKIKISKKHSKKANGYRETESNFVASTKTPIRLKRDDIYYLGLSDLAHEIKNGVSNKISERLVEYAKTFKPYRDAVCHTGVISPMAKQKITETYIKIRDSIKILLSKI